MLYADPISVSLIMVVHMDPHFKISHMGCRFKAPNHVNRVGFVSKLYTVYIRPTYDVRLDVELYRSYNFKLFILSKLGR